MPDRDAGTESRRTGGRLSGDRIATLDPAAVPLQADAEAAGTPTRNAGIQHTDNFSAAWPHSAAAHKRRVPLIWLVAVPVALGLLAGWIGWS